MGLTTSQKVRKILDNSYGVLAIEMMAAAQALDIRGGKMGKGTSIAHKVIRKYIDYLDEDRPLYDDHNKIKAVVESNEILHETENCIGEIH